MTKMTLRHNIDFISNKNWFNFIISNEKYNYNHVFCLNIFRSSERYQKLPWKDVRVGDLVHLSNNETVPADILLLRTSNTHGVCYIDTCDLDGETNLKLREVNFFFILSIWQICNFNAF